MRFFLIIVLLLQIKIVTGQTMPIMGTITYNDTLSNVLFNKTDSIKDKIWLDSGLDYYNKPINARAVPTGDFAYDTLLFCDCLKKHDTLIVTLSAPSACCYNLLVLKLINNSFTSSVFASVDISPSTVFMYPVQQTLMLKQPIVNTNLVQGYIYFNGQGKYQRSRAVQKLTRTNKKAIFKEQIQGYFKCKIK